MQAVHASSTARCRRDTPAQKQATTQAKHASAPAKRTASTQKPQDAGERQRPGFDGQAKLRVQAKASMQKPQDAGER